jgi:putative membrane protein
VQAGIGGVNDLTPTTLEGGMNLIRAGLDNPAVNFPAATGPCDPNAAQGATGYCGLKDALQLLGFGLDNPACNLADPTNPTNPCGALQGVNGVRTGLTGAGQPGGSIDQLSGGVAAAQAECQKILASGTADVANTTAAMTCVGILTQVSTGIEGPGGLRVQTKQGADSLGLVSNGLTAQALPAIAAMVAGIGTDAAPQTLLNGTARVKGGLSNPACSLADPQNTANPCGVSQVQGLVSAGIDQLVTAISTGIASAIGVASPGCDPAATLACGAAALGAGATTLSTGADQLATGLATLSSGSQQAASGASDLTTGADALASGSAQVASGADQVAAGNQDLATGLRKLSGGASKVSDGAGQLATGLAPAASGAGQISAGLAKAVPGGMAIEDGANQLSAQGSKALIATGNDTANSYGEQYAVMEALNARSATLAGVPDGPAKGAAVVTSGAFGYTLAGVSKADTSNELRFVLAGLLLAAAVGLGIAFARD